MRKKALSSFMVMMFSISVSGCYFFPTEEEVLEPPIVKVEDIVYKTYTAKTKDMEETLLATGYIISQTEVEQSYKQALYPLKIIYVKTGDFVKKGDLLAELDTGDLEREVVLQRLLVQKAENKYKETAKSSDYSQVLYEREKLSQMESDIASSKLYASTDGQISFRADYSSGDEIKPYDVIVKIIDPENIYIKHTSTTLKEFVLDMPVYITVSDEVYEGYVFQTPNEADGSMADDESSIFFKFKDKKPSYKKIGSSASVKAVLDVHEDAVVVPRHLVKYLDGKTYVQVFKDDKKIDVDVTTGITTATEIEITSGLKAGDKVVVS